MKKINHKKRNWQGFKQENGKQGEVTPLSRRMDGHAFAGMKLVRRILKKLKDIEDFIEIIAREIKRQLDRQ